MKERFCVRNDCHSPNNPCASQVEGNVVFAFLDTFEPDAAKVDELKAHYRRSGLGDSVVKRVLNERLQELIEPIRARCREFEADKAEVMAILKRDTLRAREVAEATLAEVKGAMGLTYFD